MRASLLAIALLATALVSCGDSDGTPIELSLSDLARFSERYDGERVATRGIVRSHPDPEHYWIEDADLNRVRIRPHSAVEALVGERVRIVGRFYYSSDTGRRIEAELARSYENGTN